MPRYEGEDYRDDRLYVLHITRGYLDPPQDGVAWTTIFHEEPPRPPGPRVHDLWCLVTYRNTDRYPPTRVDHFRSRELAEHYRRQVEPQTPLISLAGRPMQPVLTYPDWLILKHERGWGEYDHREVFGPGGSHPHEMMATAASEVRIYSTG